MVEMLSASPGFTRPCAECGEQKRTVYLAHDGRCLCEDDYITYRARIDRRDYSGLDEICAVDREDQDEGPDGGGPCCTLCSRRAAVLLDDYTYCPACALETLEREGRLKMLPPPDVAEIKDLAWEVVREVYEAEFR